LVQFLFQHSLQWSLQSLKSAIWWHNNHKCIYWKLLVLKWWNID
jgi:hypothetical protein